MRCGLTENTKKYLGVLLKLFFTVGSLYFIIDYVSIDKLSELLKKADYFYLIVVLVFLLINLFIQFLKWKYISSQLLGMKNSSIIISSMFQGFTAGLFTPLRTGEYVARKIPFKNIALKEVATSTLIDKIVSMFALILLGILSVLILLLNQEVMNAYLFGFSLIALLAIAFWFYNNITNGGSAINSLIKYFLRIKYVGKFVNDIQALKELDKKLLNKILFLSLILYLVICFQYALLFLSFGLNIPVFLGVLLSSVILFLKNYIPAITIGGTGIREIVSVLVFAEFGLNEAVAVNTSIMIFIVNIALPALVGIYFTLKESGK